jgi:anti-sigma B factor antagonist
VTTTSELALVLVIEPTFEVAEFGRWAVMRVTGEIDMATAPRLRQHVQTVTARKPAGLVLDLDRVDFIDSTGLGVMVGAAKRMRMIDGGFRIVCSQKHLNSLFEITRLNEVFDLYESLEDALSTVEGANIDSAGNPEGAPA